MSPERVVSDREPRHRRGCSVPRPEDDRTTSAGRPDAQETSCEASGGRIWSIMSCRGDLARCSIRAVIARPCGLTSPHRRGHAPAVTAPCLGSNQRPSDRRGNAWTAVRAAHATPVYGSGDAFFGAFRVENPLRRATGLVGGGVIDGSSTAWVVVTIPASKLPRAVPSLEVEVAIPFDNHVAPSGTTRRDGAPVSVTVPAQHLECPTLRLCHHRTVRTQQPDAQTSLKGAHSLAQTLVCALVRGCWWDLKPVQTCAVLA